MEDYINDIDDEYAFRQMTQIICDASTYWSKAEGGEKDILKINIKVLQRAQNALKDRIENAKNRALTPLHIKWYGNFSSYDPVIVACGNCPCCFEEVNSTEDYCPKCGQALDWMTVPKKEE